MNLVVLLITLLVYNIYIETKTKKRVETGQEITLYKTNELSSQTAMHSCTNYFRNAQFIQDSKLYMWLRMSRLFLLSKPENPLPFEIPYVSNLMKIAFSPNQLTINSGMEQWCLSQEDLLVAEINNIDLLYGEITPKGLSTALSSSFLKALEAKSFYDLGMGVGKCVIQAFNDYDNLEKVVGIEISKSRYLLAEKALLRVVFNRHSQMKIVYYVQGKSLVVKSPPSRSIHLQRKDFFHVDDIRDADIIVMQTVIPVSRWQELTSFIASLKDTTRLLTYHYLPDIFSFVKAPLIVRRLPQTIDCRIQTTYAIEGGHELYFWEKNSSLAAIANIS